MPKYSERLLLFAKKLSAMNFESISKNLLSFLVVIFLEILFSAELRAAENLDPECFGRLMRGMVTDYTGTGALSYRKLPREISFRPTQPELNRMTSLATRAFKKESKLKKVMVAVDHLAEDSPMTPDLKTVLRLKTGRKYGVMIRESFLLFDRKHKVPKNLEHFVSKFGKLNDAIRVGAPTKEISHAAQEVRKSFEELPDLDVIEKLHVTSPEDFNDYFRDTLAELRRLLGKDILTSEEYHSTRKTMRRLGTYYQLKNAVIPTVENENVMKYLKALSDAMGDTHNDMIQKTISGEEKYEDILQPLEVNIRKNIRKFLDAVENDQDHLLGN